MDIRCPACAARVAVDDDTLRGTAGQVHCPACNTVWHASAMPTASPRVEQRAAVVRRGDERETRDLFATRDPDVGSVTQTLAPPSFGSSGGVGARNETSVLFRVDQLRAKPAAVSATPAPAVEPSWTPPSAEDDGVIDLKALASAPPRRAHAPVAPLFSEPLAVSVDVGAGAKRSTKAPGINLKLIGAIAAAAAFVVVAGFGVSLAFKGEEPIQHTARIMATEAPVAPAPAPTADPAAPTTAAAPIASAEDDADDAAGSADKPIAKKSGKKANSKAKTKAKAAKSGPSKARPASKAKASADPCRCKGDFNCILACTVKRGK